MTREKKLLGKLTNKNKIKTRKGMENRDREGRKLKVLFLPAPPPI
jgi:hypothetical protein